MEQLGLWGPRNFPVDPPPAIFHCGGCGKPITEDEQTASLWGECKECENERLEDMWAG